MSELEIVIWGDREPCVEEFNFIDSIGKQKRTLIRGRVAHKRSDGSFHFTSAVHALVVLALRQASDPTTLVALSGNGPSPALSLEYAILRKPSWIQDLFGVDAKGNPLVLRYFNRVNAGFKRAAPIKVAINPGLLSGQNITCVSNGRLVSSHADLAALADFFEALWLERVGVNVFKTQQSGDSLL